MRDRSDQGWIRGRVNNEDGAGWDIATPKSKIFKQNGNSPWILMFNKIQIEKPSAFLSQSGVAIQY